VKGSLNVDIISALWIVCFDNILRFMDTTVLKQYVVNKITVQLLFDTVRI